MVDPPRRSARVPGLLAHQLRPSAVLEEELDWFFTRAESDMGLRSNFEALMEMASTGLVGTLADPADEAAEDRIEAAHAERVIRRRLQAMPVHQLGVLVAAFEPHPWPSNLHAELGQLTGIVVRLATAKVGAAGGRQPRASHVAAAAVALSETLKSEGAVALALLRSEAHGLLLGALRAYARVRGLGPSIAPRR